MKRFRDPDIRVALREVLLRTHVADPDVVIVEEFGCETVRADLAVINGSMHCYEIKSGFDKLDRLEQQIPGYSAIFDRVTLVVEGNHLLKAKELIPSWWGLQEARFTNGQISFKRVRSGRINKKLDTHRLARMLWQKDAMNLLLSHSAKTDVRTLRVAELWKLIGDNHSPKVISDAVREAIKRRGGSGFRSPLFQSDGSSPKRSSWSDSPS